MNGFVDAAAKDVAIGQTINLGSGRAISMGDLANLIIKLMGKHVTVATEAQRARPASSEVDRLLADNTLARELLGWTPQIPLRSACKKQSNGCSMAKAAEMLYARQI